MSILLQRVVVTNIVHKSHCHQNIIPLNIYILGKVQPGFAFQT